MFSRFSFAAIAIVSLVSFGPRLSAAGGQEPPPSKPSKLTKDPALVPEIQALVDAGKFAKAEARAIAALTQNGADAEVFNLLGFSRRKQGKWKDSINAYRKALEMNPDFAQAKEYLAVAYLNIKRVDDARALHKELRKSDPELAAMVAMEAKRLKIKL